MPDSTAKTEVFSIENSLSFEYAAHADSRNTQRAYVADWKHFSSWCEARNGCPLPAEPDQVALYARTCVMDLKLKASSVQRRMAAISQTHLRSGHPSPTKTWVVQKTLSRLRREFAAPARKSKPLLPRDLSQIITTLPKSIVGARDKAILLLCFAGGMTRSELVALDVEDLEIAEKGLVTSIRCKDTSAKENRKIGIPYSDAAVTCPVRATLAWLGQSRIANGPLFRGISKFARISGARLTPQAVYLIVKRSLKNAGKDPTPYGAHSLRLGLITAAARGGATAQEIQDQTGHKSLLILRQYMRGADLFRNNVLAKTGL